MLCILTDTLLAVLLVAVAVLMVVGLSAPGAVASAAGLGKSILAVTSGSMSPLLRVGDAIVADVEALCFFTPHWLALEQPEFAVDVASDVEGHACLAFSAACMFSQSL
jgi:hypothetical protein